MSSPFHEWRVLLSVLVVLGGCAKGPTETVIAPGVLPVGNRQSTLQPGEPIPQPNVQNPLEGNPNAIEDGRRLFNQMNCSGCHAAGGGAIGPALIDDEWIYGSSAENIYWTILEGRPHGMPSFGGKISRDQTWRIVAFVRDLAGLKEKQ